MRELLLILSVAVSLNGFSQAKTKMTDKEIMKTWVLEKGKFPEDVVKFRTLNLAKDSATFYDSYEFKENGEIKFIHHEPTGLIACRHGKPYVTKSKWTLNENKLNIHIEGGYNMESEYIHDVIYAVLVTNTKLELKKLK